MEKVFVGMMLYVLMGWVVAVTEVRRGNSQRLCKWLGPLGAFVYGDMVVLGGFWMIALMGLWILDWRSGLNFVYALFWVVRSAGEVMYWMLEQFQEEPLNKLRDVPTYHWYKSEAAYYGTQVVWQCVLVIALAAAYVFRP